MSQRRSQFSWCDVLLVVTVLLVGYAAYLLIKTEPEITAAQQESDELRTIFKECQTLAREGILDPERARRESDLKWQETLLLESEYSKIAERLKNEVPDLKRVLDQTGLQKGVVEREPGQQDLKNWIQRQREWPRFEDLASRSKELKERLATQPVPGTNGAIQLNNDVGGLLTEIEQAYQRYSTELKGVSDNARKP